MKSYCSVENIAIRGYQSISGFDDGSLTFINSAHHRIIFNRAKSYHNLLYVKHLEEFRASDGVKDYINYTEV
ncbi:MAG: hypothetical protein DRP01_03565 [Archaeoglobales archaeon]|nr:MAG: hypothetical protein DRP01_03565 [Archaeoglobales archaeon]